MSSTPVQNVRTVQIGALLNRRYRLDAELGKGGMGVVFRAHDTLMERGVALKALLGAGLGSEGRARLLREARAAAQLNHPNIVGIYDAGEDEGVSFIVMELVEELTLFERKPVDLDEILAIMRQICDALEHAHAHGIVHRDLKPENVILAADGAVKLTDFGLARSVASRVSTEGALVGTVLYLPPEQALGQEVDGRADLYALGVMLYELVSGRLPFTADDPLTVISQHVYAPVVPPSAYNPHLPPALDALIVQLLSKQPADRPASAAEVRQALEGLVGLEPGGALKLSPLDQLVRGRLVGRERELAEARAVWKQVVAGDAESRVLLISGESGLGKTPLARAIRTLAEVSGGRALVGECYAEGSPPYAPIAHIIREALPPLADDLPDLVKAGLIALAPEMQTCCPYVPPNPPLDPLAEQQRLFESMVALCTALTARTPLLLVVEDVQWADGGTLALLRHLARRGRSTGLKLLLVLTYRETELDQAHPLNDVLFDLTRERLAVHIKLAPFDREQTRQLLGVMFQEEIGDEFVHRIYRETEGNLFFIEEICKALIEDGLLVREGGRWHWPDMNQARLPQSVRLAIQSRVGKLPSQAQEVLQLAAIVGREFDFDTLARAGELDEEALIDALEAAERAQLIAEVKRNGRETFAFAHGLTLAALREGVSGMRRRRLHRRVATAIAAVRPDDLEALAYHYGEAGDDAHALDYNLRAAERARQVYANEEAICFYTEALALLPADHPQRFEALAARSQVYDVAARREEQRADVEAMLALAERLDDDARRCDAWIALADLYMETEPFRAREPAERAVALAQKLGDPLREGHALRRVGFDAWHRSDYVRSREALEAAVARFREARVPGEAAACLHNLALTLGQLSEVTAAREAAKEALALSRQAGDRRQEATSLRRLAIAYMDMQQYAEALPCAEAALALHRQLGDRSQECNALNVVGLILAWLGQPQEAEAYIRQSLALAEEIRFSLGMANAVDNLLWIHFEWQGEYEAGLGFVEQELEKARLGGDAFLLAHLEDSLARMLLRLGQYAPALERMQAAHAATAEVPVKNRIWLGYLHAELGDYARARQYVQAVLDEVEGTGRSGELAMALLLGAHIDFQEGQATRLRPALERVERAIGLLEKTGFVYELAEAFTMAAQLHLALGEPQAALRVEPQDKALTCSTEAVRAAARLPVEAEKVLWLHSRALRAAGREVEADEYLQRAYARVQLVAGKTQDTALRRGWLENVWVNREILADWADRGMD